MPSLVKDSRGRSSFWICCYTTADGQRLKKSTKQTDRAAAWEVCLGIAHAEKLATDGSLTEQATKKILNDILERTTGHPLRSYKVSAWLDKWVAEKRETLAGKTIDRYDQIRREFVESLGARAKLPLNAVTDEDILAYRKSMQAGGLAPKSCNNAVKCLSAAFNQAVRKHLISQNPCTAIDPLEEDTASRKTFTTAQVKKLIAAAEGDWRLAILFGYYTGARLGDVASLKWNQIDFAEHMVEFVPKKTRKRKTVVRMPLHTELEAELLKSPGIGPAPIFPALTGKDTGGCNGLSAQFAEVMKRAGIKAHIIQHTKGGRKNTDLSFHSLRHTFNSALANEGVSQEVRQKLTGHKTKEANDVYTHHDAEVLRTAISSVPAISNL